RGLENDNVGGMLHHREIDRGLFKSRIDVAKGSVIGPRRHDPFDAGRELRLVLSQFSEDRRRLPDEDSAVPKILAAGEELFRDFEFRLLAKLKHFVSRNILPRLELLAAMDVAVARRWEIR